MHELYVSMPALSMITSDAGIPDEIR
jgi:hypothetical protein